MPAYAVNLRGREGSRPNVDLGRVSIDRLRRRRGGRGPPSGQADRRRSLDGRTHRAVSRRARDAHGIGMLAPVAAARDPVHVVQDAHAQTAEVPSGDLRIGASSPRTLDDLKEVVLNHVPGVPAGPRSSPRSFPTAGERRRRCRSAAYRWTSAAFAGPRARGRAPTTTSSFRSRPPRRSRPSTTPMQTCSATAT